jgi:hypothetical protein
MTRRTILSDPNYWRSQADGMRAIVDELEDVPSRSILARIAVDFDRLADRAEIRSAARPDGKVVRLNKRHASDEE